MQKLFVESHLPVTPEVAWDVFESEPFREALAERTNLASRVLEVRQEGEVEVRVIEFTSGQKLPGVVAKALGSDRLSYTQTNRFDRSRSRLDWTVALPALGERVSVSGETLIEPHPQGCRRVVNGEIEVRIRLVGGQIERVVAGEFQRSMERAVDLARDMLPDATS